MIEFSPVMSLDRDSYNKALLLARSPLCEYCYGNILAWSSFYRTEYTVFFEDVYVFCYDIEGKKRYSFPIGVENEVQLAEIITALLAQAESEGNTLQLTYASRLQTEAVERLFPGRFSFSACRDNFDYLYETEKLKTFSGKKLHGKKNHLNKFYALYGDQFTYETITADNIASCIALNKKWCEINKKYEDIDLRTEEKVAAIFLNQYNCLPLVGGLLSVNGEPCAYTIGEEAFPGSDTLIIHIEKALYEIQGAYPAVFSMFLKENPRFLYVNREDDLGNEGLRTSKLSYQPSALLEKFLCTLN